MHRHRTTLVVAIVLLGVLAGCQGEDDEPFPDEITALLDAEVAAAADDGELGGVVVRVVTPQAQRTIAVGPAGVEDGEPTEERLEGDEAFRVGGVTKTVTAAAALRMAERRAIDLDASVIGMVPDRAGRFERGRELTLRRLLRHTGGLAREVEEPAHVVDERALLQVDDDAARLACADLEEQYDWIDHADQRSLRPPGRGVGYSYLGYRLAGEALATVDGRSVSGVLREEVLDPLGMEESWLACGGEPRADLAGGIHEPGVGRRYFPEQATATWDVTDLHRDGGAAAGLVATADDLVALARGLFGGELFDDDGTIDEMLRPGPDPSYGMGLELLDGGWVGHRGSVDGYHAQVLHHPESDVTLVGLGNATPRGTGTPAALAAVDAVIGVLDEFPEARGTAPGI